MLSSFDTITVIFVNPTSLSSFAFIVILVKYSSSNSIVLSSPAFIAVFSSLYDELSPSSSSSSLSELDWRLRIGRARIEYRRKEKKDKKELTALEKASF